jgi:phosphate transport system substrate-binding protein
MIGSKEVLELVGATPTAIGYSGMGYVTPTVKLLRVKRTPADQAHAPSVATILTGAYALARSLQVYTLGQPQGATKAYLEWILSDAGQKAVEASGYVPLPAAHNQRP